MRFVVAFIAGIAAVTALWFWYTHPKLPASVHIWRETDDGFSFHHANLRRSIAKALHGSDSDVLDFIAKAGYTDGAGAYGFGDVLLTIAKEIGDERFARILPDVPSDQRERVWLLFGAGAEYRSKPLSTEELHRQLPKTMQIMDEWQLKT